MTGAAIIFLLVVTSGCTESTPEFRGIHTRIYVDRTEARVGDLLGVTVEVDTPEGFAVEAPDAPPSDEHFVTDRVERLRPVEIPGGVRHRILWSLRPRTVGDHRLPELSVPTEGFSVCPSDRSRSRCDRCGRNFRIATSTSTLRRRPPFRAVPCGRGSR